ncbi:hypothetical protein EUZ87_07075 [Lactiplantibacillus paraplantarum]|uniref:Uncharacterized protein n=1 Tax=Lactiplantibacillus paraplantarum TaxID=60520 RepID=A0A4Q9Y1Q7_9LACO|nr:hypothetical protein EUZ87_07075 [Lactiplantibacillus paraplantarum]
MGGQYLKRGLWLEFVSIMFRQLAEMSVSWCRSSEPSKFMLNGTFSSGPQLGVFVVRLWPLK